ncbi:LacI family DNA-binding transcriptional regulator [Nakamurella sp. YIM 132087]|uniref:LacI family DNA-binding transcriptional regulator n=1 Tax=Nakamurella alba TaxID=2665158 RepID=A0A7K1FM29_9ACTN|nr:LacI family DNA-binding transcriptional regulator [Nakamurella alba]MTD15207.1 LacI family DNA-binding transcriptional regulator [Nakamurella alba]
MTSQTGKPTLRDVAREAGVDVATASRSLSPTSKRPVNEQTRSRVKDVAQRLGYLPDEAARTLRTSRSRAVGVLIPNMANPAMPPLVQGVEQVLTQHGYTTLFADTVDDAGAESARIATFLSWRISGLILVTARRADTMPAVLHGQEIPVVLLSRKFSGSAAPSASADEAVGVQQALQHLVDLGHRRIAYIGQPLMTSIGYEKLLAFRDRSAALGLDVPQQHVVVCPGFQEPDGFAAASAVLAGPARPTAILCGNDMMALGCLRALAAAGLRCPEDVSVIGYHDIPLVDRLSPPLTTIRVPYFDMGVAAADLLVDALSGVGGGPHSVVVHPQLVVRGTTGPVREVSSS